jgi:class 3 adenylate cyclase
MFALDLKVHLSLAPKVDTDFGDDDHRDVKSLFTVEQITKKLAVLFADICGSTSLYDDIGDDLARHFTANCIKIMVSQISPHKGTLIKTIGDEIMCTFPNATSALNAACAMQHAVKNNAADSKQPLSIRIGFHYGLVICEANDVFGDTVNVAARVAGLAKADQIMTTVAVYVALPAELQKNIKSYKSISLKGKQAQSEIYWVLWKDNNKDNNNETPVLSSPVISHYDTRFSTQVILKYIPQNTTYKQILQFVAPALKGGLFSKSGTVEHITVLAQKERLSDTTDFHAILSIKPNEAAKRIINKLHRKQLNSRHIAVAEYIERSIYNSRTGNMRIKDNHPENSHVADRRNIKLFRLITIGQLKDFSWTENAEE